MKAGRTILVCAVAGALANLNEAWDGANEVEVRFSSPWFCPFCRAKAQCGKEASLLKPFWLRFSLLFVFIGAQDGYAVCGDKSDWPSRGQERVCA